MNKTGLFIGGFVETYSKKLPIGCSFAGNYYQLKVFQIIDFELTISLNYSNDEIKSKNKVLQINLKQNKVVANLIKVLKNIFVISKNKFDFIVFYNLSFYSLIYFLFYCMKKNVKVIVIMADTGYIFEKTLYSKVLTKSLYLADGFLSLRNVPELNKYCSKIEVMPGIITNNRVITNTSKKKNTVFLSGSLGFTTGIELALIFFSRQNKFKLIITGKPYLITDDEFDSLLTKYKSENIDYLGVLDYDNYQRILATCEFGLSLRNPSELEHRANFPSKILEYMSFGCIVISSISYDELNNETYILTEYSHEGMKQCFNKINSNYTPQSRELIVKKALEEIKYNYSPEVFRQKLNKLIS